MGGRPDLAPPQRPQQRPPPPLLARRRGLKLACSGLALLTVYWIWAWYPQGDGFAAGRSTQKGQRGVFRTFRLRCAAACHICCMHP